MNLKEIPDTLPDKLSDLIRVGLNDIAKAKRIPRVYIDMRKWMCPVGDVCVVCLSGSVMLGLLPPDCRGEHSPDDFNASIAKKLHALNWIRTGDTGYALHILEVSPLIWRNLQNFTHQMNHYHAAGYNLWRRDMHNIADYLELKGL